MLRIVEETHETEEGLPLDLDELAREGARRMLKVALEAEVVAYLERYAEDRDEQGHARVVRNGHGRARKVTVGSGTLEVQAPRVNDRRIDAHGQRQRFSSRILPPYMRRSPKVAEVLPILYLRGRSTGDFREALPVLLGPDAAGLSPANIARLTACWEGEYKRFRGRSLRRPGLRLRLGRWHPRQHPARRGSAVPAGHDRRAAGRDQGADRGGGWIPREHRELAVAAARSEEPGDEGTGGGGGCGAPGLA